jgi:hypothetical protein
MSIVGRIWEFLKAVAVVLWPIRFVLLVMLTLTLIFCLPQAQDALFGAVIEGRNRLLLFCAAALWALQSWYWSRFLLGVGQRNLPTRIYSTTQFSTDFVNRVVEKVPRALGAFVFFLVGFFIYASSWGSACPDEAERCGPKWGSLYLLAGVVFVLATRVRRRVLTSRGAQPIQPLQPVPATISRPACFGMWVWIVLLAAAAISSLVDFHRWHVPGTQFDVGQIIALGFVVVLFLTSAFLLIELPLPKSTKGFVALLVMLNSGLFVVSILAPAWAGMRLGPAVVLMLSAGIWVGATSFFLAFPGERLRLPITTLAVLGALIFGFAPKLVALLSNSGGDYDNHRVRLLPDKLMVGQADQRVPLYDAFEAWQAQAPCYDDRVPCRKPMILIAAEGGASRSGYWVATVLGSLEDVVKDFHRSVFAISSVSGGSLGAAVYQRLVARKQSGQNPLCSDSGGSNSVAICGQRVIEKDFLGPVFFSMFNADLLQRLLPGDLMPDRAQALETAWERAWRQAIGSDDFAGAFQIRNKKNPTGASGQEWLPVLFLNGASVKTGRRIITSDIALEPECHSSDLLPRGSDLPSVLDFFCLTRREVRLSTAVHNSARFPYISPAGTLWANSGAGHSWKADRIVDGGYFEGEGASTLIDLLDALAAHWEIKKRSGEGNKYSGNWDDKLVPIVISIQNDPLPPQQNCDHANPDDVACDAENLSKTLGDEAGTMSWIMQIANDLFAPPIGLGSSRSGRGAYAARALAVKQYFADRPAYNFNLRERHGPEPAMSWYLSTRSQRDMASDLCKPGGHLEDGINELGRELRVNNMMELISEGPGCRALQVNAAPRPER